MIGKNFYKDIKSLRVPITEVFYSHNFSTIPSDWHIIISDVKNSTTAVNSGKHNDVNLIAAGSLIAALNVAKSKNIQIPYFFSGDGGTVLVPQEILNDVLLALSLHNENSIQNFNLEMHIGSISMKEIQEAGHYLRIAKLQFGKDLDKAIIIGDGFGYAEKIIKNSSKDRADDNINLEALNLEGLECRWDKIKPPEQENEIICYLIETLDPEKQIEIYRNVLLKIDEIYGDIKQRNPLSLHRLRLLISFQKLQKELMAKYGNWELNTLITTFLQTFLGKIFFKYNLKKDNLRGKEYLAQIITNADTLTIDGRINTIITGTKNKRIQFHNYLSEMEKEGNLIYGYHVSKESVMTCYIENRDSKHIHFVDGSDGGYTEAAKDFKTKSQDYNV